MTERAPIRDCGPEFGRRIDREVYRFAQAFTEIARSAPNCRTAGERAQAECDRLLTLSDEDLAHARR